MRRSLLDLFRGRDGHSLARALAVLLALNALIAGFHAGALAAEPPGAALCAIAQPEGDKSPPADHPEPCCLAGCTAPAVALPPSADAILGGLQRQLPAPIPVLASPAVRRAFDHVPRGPPLFV